MIIISILIFIVSLLLMGIVLIQNSKGGGLASGFQSSNQIVGVQRTTDFLEKGTWILAVSLFALCLVSTAFTGTTVQTESQSDLQQVIDQEAPIAPPQGFDESNAPLPDGETE